MLLLRCFLRWDRATRAPSTGRPQANDSPPGGQLWLPVWRLAAFQASFLRTSAAVEKSLIYFNKRLKTAVSLLTFSVYLLRSSAQILKSLRRWCRRGARLLGNHIVALVHETVSPSLQHLNARWRSLVAHGHNLFTLIRRDGLRNAESKITGREELLQDQPGYSSAKCQTSSVIGSPMDSRPHPTKPNVIC